MGRFALLVGISDYKNSSPMLPTLPSAVRDVDALKEVLTDPNIGGFEDNDVKVCKNIDANLLTEEIERFFSRRKQDDLLLFYFSGHGVTDRKDNFYLSGTSTKENFLLSTAVWSDVVHKAMDAKPKSNYQVIILDCCHSGAFPKGMKIKGWKAEDIKAVDVLKQLGGEGRAILTASNSTQYAFEEEGYELSLYTHFLVNGLRTGDADLDKDGYVSVDEIHRYILDNVKSVNDEMSPEFYPVKYGHRIILAKAANNTSKTVPPIEVKTEKVVKQNNAVISSLDLGDGIILEMASIPAGSFIMGASKSEDKSEDNERPQHAVNIQPFLMSIHPITREQWKKVAALQKCKRELKPDPSWYKGSELFEDNKGKLPIERVSWLDAIEFCARLSQHTRRQYRLPSEAEWEYACRAFRSPLQDKLPTNDEVKARRYYPPFHFGETITTEYVNYNGNYPYGDTPLGENRNMTIVVGSLKFANNFGLFDMHGNIREWCADDWHDNYDEAPTDGSIWKKNNRDYESPDSKKVVRGGSWGGAASECRSAHRAWFNASPGQNIIGFRVVCNLP